SGRERDPSDNVREEDEHPLAAEREAPQVVDDAIHHLLAGIAYDDPVLSGPDVGIPVQAEVDTFGPSWVAAPEHPPGVWPEDDGQWKVDRLDRLDRLEIVRWQYRSDLGLRVRHVIVNLKGASATHSLSERRDDELAHLEPVGCEGAAAAIQPNSSLLRVGRGRYAHSGGLIDERKCDWIRCDEHTRRANLKYVMLRRKARSCLNGRAHLQVGQIRARRPRDGVNPPRACQVGAADMVDGDPGRAPIS